MDVPRDSVILPWTWMLKKETCKVPPEEDFTFNLNPSLCLLNDQGKLINLLNKERPREG